MALVVQEGVTRKVFRRRIGMRRREGGVLEEDEERGIS